MKRTNIHTWKEAHDQPTYEITDEDRGFFDDLVKRTPEGSINEPEEIVAEEVIEVEAVPEEEELEFPEWYRPWMCVSWVNGVPIKPPTKEEKSMGNWV